MQSPAGREVLAGEAIEAFPVEPGTLTPAKQSMAPSPPHFASEAIQSL